MREYNLNNTEAIIRANLLDMRQLKTVHPCDIYDIKTEKDAFLSVRSEVYHKILKKVKFWGIIDPKEIDLITMADIQHVYTTPTCIDATFTNIWGADVNSDDNGKHWNNLYILSPNLSYPNFFKQLLDIG